MNIPSNLVRGTPGGLLFLVVSASFASGPLAPKALAAFPPVELGSSYSNFEGISAPKHAQELQKFSRRYFIDESGEVAPDQLAAFLAKLRQDRVVIAESVRMSKKWELIHSYGYSEAEAEKSAAKETEVVVGFDLAIAGIDAFLRNHSRLSPVQRRDEMARLLLLATACETLQDEQWNPAGLRGLRNLIQSPLRVKADDRKSLQASNLVYNGQFQAPEDLKRLRAEGVDLSTLNPPNTAFWSDNRVEDYDPDRREFYGDASIFPPEGIPLHYTRMGNGTIKVKADWYEERVLPSGEIRRKKRGVSLRFGGETHTVILTGHLARAVGYPAIPYRYYRSVKLLLGDVSYDRFLNEWEDRHGNGQTSGSSTHVSYIEKYLPEENAIILKSAAIEAYPDDKDDYVKIGPFRMGRNGLQNRREYRAQAIYGTLINLGDTGDEQVRLDAYRDRETGNWRPLMFLSDTGSALGFFVGSVNEFWNNAANTHRENGRITQVDLLWFRNTGFHPNAYRNMTYSDGRWLLKRYARLSDEQIVRIARASGYPEPIVQVFAQKLLRRLNDLFEGFGLIQDGSVRAFPVRPWSDLHAEFPEYIDADGRVRDEAERIPGNTAQLTRSLREAAATAGVNFLNNRLSSALQLSPNLFGASDTFSMGSFGLDWGPAIKGTRSIRYNEDRGPHQGKFLVRDTYTLSIPIGVSSPEGEGRGASFKLPAGAAYIYRFSYFHSYRTLRDAAKISFFKRIAPWKIQDARKKLAPGEALHIQQTLSTALGTAELRFNDRLGASVSVFGRDESLVKELYVSRTDENRVEVLAGRHKELMLRNAVELSAFVRLAMSREVERSKKVFKAYRFDLTEGPSEKNREAEQAFRDILDGNDFTLADRMALRYVIRDSESVIRDRFAFMLWERNRAQGARELEFEEGPAAAVEDVRVIREGTDRAELVLIGSQFQSNSKDYSALQSGGLGTGIGNLPFLGVLGSVTRESTGREIRIEALAKDDTTGFDELELTIDLQRADNWARRSEFERDFLHYFNRRSGPAWTRQTLDREDAYFSFEMPDGLRSYSPVMGHMHWQIGSAGVRELLTALKEEEILKRIAQNTYIPWYRIRNDDRFIRGIRSRIAIYERAVPAGTTYEQRKALLRDKIQALVEVIQWTIGKDSNQLGWIRSWVSEPNLWLVTSLTHVLENSVGLAAEERGIHLYAPEVGRFQGQSFTRRFSREARIRPNLFYAGSSPDF